MTAPADPMLKSFGFEMNVPAAVVFRGFVFAWDGTKATGQALYESAPRRTAGSSSNELITFTPGALRLTPGRQYVLFVSTSEDNYAGGTANGTLGDTADTAYSGGTFVHEGSAADPSQWTSSPTTWGTAGLDLQFQAAFGGAASAATGEAAGVSQTGATLQGTFNPNALPTTAYFEYGPTTAYGSRTGDQDAGSGTSDIAESATLAGLAPGGTVHYRAVAQNAAGTFLGPDRTLTTAAPPIRDATPPSVTVAKLPSTVKLKALLRNGVTFTESANEPAAFVDTLLGNARSATLRRVRVSAFNLTLAQRTLALGTGTRTVKLKPSRKLIGKAKKFRLRIQIVAADATGNHTTKTRTIKVH